MSENQIDQILQDLGMRNIGNTPSLNKNDNASSSNFYDYVLNSIDTISEKVNKSFSELEFMGMVLHYEELNYEDLKERTSPAFVSKVLGHSKLSESLKKSNHCPTI